MIDVGKAEGSHAMGFKNVVAGQEARIGTVREDETYRFDTSLSAEIPLHTKTKAEPRNDDEAEAADQTHLGETVPAGDSTEAASKTSASKDGEASQ